MKPVKTLFVVLLLAATSAIATPARAAGTAICMVNGQLTLKPGLTFMGGTSTYSSRGYTGTIDCHGSVNGHQISGPGKLTNHGTIKGSCAESAGKGRFVARIPTADGSLSLPGTYSFQTLGAAGPFSGAVFSGAFEFMAERGDCLSSPLTRVTVMAQGILTT